MSGDEHQSLFRRRRWRSAATGWLLSTGLVLVLAVTGVIELLKPHVPVLSLVVLSIFAVLVAAFSRRG